jgi:hypothetical protein
MGYFGCHVKNIPQERFMRRNRSHNHHPSFRRNDSWVGIEAVNTPITFRRNVSWIGLGAVITPNFVPEDRFIGRTRSHYHTKISFRRNVSWVDPEVMITTPHVPAERFVNRGTRRNSHTKCSDGTNGYGFHIPGATHEMILSDHGK